MDELLKTWCMPEAIIEAFRNNEIDETHLPHISDELLKELCPVMGIRIDLRKRISEHLDAQATTLTATSIDTLISDSTLQQSINTAEEISAIGNISFSLSDLFPMQSSFKDFDLSTLLATSPCGKSILEYYTANGCLDTKRRNRLTDIIIRHLFTFIINHRLSYDDYNIIAGKIITLFPKESAATYFTRPIKKGESFSGKSVAARGKLIDKVRNILFESGERKRKQDKNSNEEEVTNKKALSGSLLELFKEETEWLNTHEEPWSEVLSKWKKTVEARHSKEYLNIEDFISQWRILTNLRGVELIDEDFKYLHPEKVDNFAKNWHIFFDKLKDIKKTDIIADSYKADLAASLNHVDHEDQKIASQLTLLVHLVPPKGRYTKKDKISVQECLESIMILIENPADISNTVDKQKEKALKRKQPVQPYLILLGNLQNIRQLYLVIDKIGYTFYSIEKAFDTLFKCYHVFNAKYPKASDHIFLIIQQCVYKIMTKYDNVVPYIADILKLPMLISHNMIDCSYIYLVSNI